ncbi:MAG: DUF6093 family protein [Dermatophilaceae bacterium]
MGLLLMIGHDVLAALPELRMQAESLMTETCTIDRLATTWDEAEQKSVTSWITVHADVPCSTNIPPMMARQVVTGQVVTPELPHVRVPVGFDGMEPDDRVKINDRPPVWVNQVRVKTHEVSRRLECRWLQ